MKLLACLAMLASVALAASGSSSPTTVVAPTTRANKAKQIETPSPLQPGTVANCKAFYKVQTGDDCLQVAGKNHVSLADFLAWNAQVGGEACTNLWLGYYVCVSVTEPTPTTTSSSSSLPPSITTTTTSTTTITTPTPTQEGMVRTCKAFHWVEPGQDCQTIATQYGLTRAQVIAWNPAAGPSCTGLWAHTYCCVGVV